MLMPVNEVFSWLKPVALSFGMATVSKSKIAAKIILDKPLIIPLPMSLAKGLDVSTSRQNSVDKLHCFHPGKGSGECRFWHRPNQ